MENRHSAQSARYRNGFSLMTDGWKPYTRFLKNGARCRSIFFSGSRKSAMTPVRVTSRPKMMSIETSGRTARTDSTLPRFVWVVVSVMYALNAASLAVEPKKVMTQSMTTTVIAVMMTALAPGNHTAAFLTLMNPKTAVEKPHRKYPVQMKTLRLPTLSESPPMSSVVRVAAMALAATMSAIYVGSVEIVLYRKTLKYMFSIVQANCPTRPMRMIAVQMRFVRFPVVFALDVILRPGFVSYHFSWKCFIKDCTFYFQSVQRPRCIISIYRDLPSLHHKEILVKREEMAMMLTSLDEGHQQDGFQAIVRHMILYREQSATWELWHYRLALFHQVLMAPGVPLDTLLSSGIILVE